MALNNVVLKRRDTLSTIHTIKTQEQCYKDKRSVYFMTCWDGVMNNMKTQSLQVAAGCMTWCMEGGSSCMNFK